MGAKAKITPQQVYIIGAVLTIISALVIYFTLVKPGNEALDAANVHLQAATATAEKQGAATKDRTLATREVAKAKATWDQYDRKYMPNIDVSNRLLGVQQLWHEQVEVLGPRVERFLRADHSVEIVQDGITVTGVPSDPNAVVAKQFTYDLGAVAVAGTFNDVLNHAARWNKFDRLILMDNLTLRGNSPRLIGQYSLQCFEFTHNIEKPGPVIPQAAPPTGASGGASIPGGPPAGGSYELGPPGGAIPGGGMLGPGGGGPPPPGPGPTGGPSLPSG